MLIVGQNYAGLSGKVQSEMQDDTLLYMSLSLSMLSMSILDVLVCVCVCLCIT